jgi:hypothetical protein
VPPSTNGRHPDYASREVATRTLATRTLATRTGNDSDRAPPLKFQSRLPLTPPKPMNIAPLTTSLPASSASALTEVRPASTAGPSAVAERPAGTAATWWISPPGQFFSVLHQVSQAYPVELNAALRELVRGAASPAVEASAQPSSVSSSSALSALATAVGSPSNGAAPTWHVRPGASSPPAASGEPPHPVIDAMHTLARQRVAAFGPVAEGLAATFQAVANTSNAPDAQPMAALAGQLVQAARAVSVDPGAGDEPGTGEVVGVAALARGRGAGYRV